MLTISSPGPATFFPALTRDTRVDARGNHVHAIIVLVRGVLHVGSSCATKQSQSARGEKYIASHFFMCVRVTGR